MSKNTKLVLVVVAFVAIAAGVFLITKDKSKNNETSQKLDEVKLALDWTPNTNHTGIYVAQQKGFYKDAGIDLKILPYSQAATSDSLVISGKSDVGIGFTEGVVADAGVGTPVVSIASIVAHNTSVVLARKDVGINSPKDLDGKTFGGYGAPYEEPVMKQMIKADGGKGDFKYVTVDTDPIDALATKKVDFVWVFQGWEGIQAKNQNLDLASFSLTDYGIPDYATPNIITSNNIIESKNAILKRFMEATSKGYEFARSNPEEAANLLISANDKGTFPDENLVRESQKYLSERYQDQGKKWGVTTAEFWQNYPKFMVENNAVLDTGGNPVKSIDYGSLFTNQFLE